MRKKFLIEEAYGDNPEFEYFKGVPVSFVPIPITAGEPLTIEFKIPEELREPKPVQVAGELVAHFSDPVLYEQLVYYQRLWTRYWRFVAHVLQKRKSCSTD